ncbi:cytochrome c biogenesis protein ResB [Gemmata sp. JC717]|uniref:cytochrome c biogenesis protein n=1 Tax=Gemmata algarum TaxID=2975278 RepID=UPI0021BAC8F3|nr:cytochrome c biogenesis protein ResB [Gemmata algarum]MDY3557146.1 cytochrome c biogenesis protein ResB [Gemmata algarum]
MSTTLPHTPGQHVEPPAPAPRGARRPDRSSIGYYALKGLKALSSLQLTVGLLAVGVLLVFFGTLAQLDFGIWTVVDKYFWSWTVNVPFELFHKLLTKFWQQEFPAGGAEWKGSFPFPAGKAVGLAMLVNLLAAHATRFRLTWKRTGVFLIHGGLILLFAGEFVTREFAVEQQMQIEEGSSADFATDTRNVELVLVDPTNPGFDRVTAISQQRLTGVEPGERIRHPELPVDVEVLEFMKNSVPVGVPDVTAPGEPTDGVFLAAPKGSTGAGPAAYVRLHTRGTPDAKVPVASVPLGAFAVAPAVREQRFGGGAAAGRVSLADDGLTVVDESSAGFDRVLKVSLSRLADAAPGERIGSPEIGVVVEVLKFVRRAELVRVARPEGAPGPQVVLPAGEEAGVSTKQRGDAPAAYVRLYKKGTDEAVGAFALGAQFPALMDQPVPVAGTTYRLSLRNARYQKPYRIHLDKFRFDRYEGTSKAKNYSSDVRVYDAAGNLAREQRIAMNEPLRYAGETFYQSSFDRSETTTILQVVKNPGQVDVFGLFHASIDYLACAVVGFGLVLHFGIFLTQFLVRVQTRPAPAAAPGPAPGGRTVSGAFHWIVLAVAALGLLAAAGRMTPRSLREPYDLDAFARLPVLEGGRVKPLETVARVYLRTVSHREVLSDDGGKEQPAIRWYLDVITAGAFDDDSPAWHHKVFRVENDQVRQDLKLPQREGLRYSLVELRPHLTSLEEKAAAARRNIKAGRSDVAGGKFIELEEHLTMVRALHRMKALNKHGEDTLNHLPPAEGRGWASLSAMRDAAELNELSAAHAALNKTPNWLFQLSHDQGSKVFRELFGISLDQLDEDRQIEGLRRLVEALRQPSTAVPAEVRPRWLAATLAALPAAEAARFRTDAEADYRSRVAAVPAAQSWDKMLSAYRAKDAAGFNAAVADYRGTHLGGVPPAEARRAGVEVAYNRFAPFYQLSGLYVLAFVLAVVGFVMHAAERPRWAAALRKADAALLLVLLAVHTAALLVRMYLMERPGVFVTNLYSSAIFIGWGCVALCLVLERIFPIGVGNTVAAVLGLSTCIVAHNLGTQDTLEMMEAVLDTNFWLATHVTTVTLGYTATFVAGFLGAVYIVLMLATVVRDSYRSSGEPSVGALLAFGTAVLGLVAIPVFFMWFAKAALDRFEVIPTALLDFGFWVATAAAVVYGALLLVLRVSAAGVDAQGRPLQGQVPPVAQPVTGLGLTPESGKVLGQMMYGVIAFATLLSFIGTVLGGIWADQSWGRFWGWDPKENGAVLIVLWNALILHARWCGLVKARGVAALAVFGNAITAWSWFGTNQLSIGLHAYGFDERLADGCFNFWLLQFVILLVGVAIPRRFCDGKQR